MQDEGGEVASGLLRIAAFVLALALVLFEAGAVAVNRIQLDDVGQEAARAGAFALRDQQSRRAVTQAAQEVVAFREGVVLDAVDIDGDAVTVTVSREAPVLVIDRIGPIASWAQATVTKTARVPQ